MNSSSTTFFSSPPSLLHKPTAPKSSHLHLSPYPPSSIFTELKFPIRPTTRQSSNFISYSTTVDNAPTTTSSTSLNSDDDDESDEETKRALSKIGSKVKVTVPLKVYHVPKVPEIELTGKVGTFKQYAGLHKGKRISANLPYKIEFVEDNIEGRSGPVKFSAHLKEDEFEFLD